MTTNDSCFHLIKKTFVLPSSFTWPFDYVPHSACVFAARELQQILCEMPGNIQKEINQGKMFGILVVKDSKGTLGYLAAFSGQINGSFNLNGFVPAIYDYLQSDGFYRRGERAINALNVQIESFESDKYYKKIVQEKEQLRLECEQKLSLFKQKMSEAKKNRDERRAQKELSRDESNDLIRESQFQKAEYRRLKNKIRQKLEDVDRLLEPLELKIEQLKQERKKSSECLQLQLFEHFRVQNALGEIRTLTALFKATPQAFPPSGAGECCAPKLLQHAYVNNYHPVCMAEFWWGKSPQSLIRRHLAYYPACQGKCRPILDFMLKGLSVESVLQEKNRQVKVMYEDDYLAVIDKPEGLLSVPGKVSQTSVLSQLECLWGKNRQIYVVHRLDQSTSGLMIVAKSKTIYVLLQKQFLRHTVQKIYVALLQGVLKESYPAKGKINLPLAPDFINRPCQKVDVEKGKAALTEYEVLNRDENGHTRLVLKPYTGRTHQLRVHCAHSEGLGIPILGDALYGMREDRLYLHAKCIEFEHPVRGEKMCIECEVPF